MISNFCFAGDFPAIDFETKLYSEAMTILEEHVNPRPILPGVILEQVRIINNVFKLLSFSKKCHVATRAKTCFV